ncbi:MAG: hypothetical protein H3C41_06700 [Bacteroidales bacterium]|nr:hypothetical protein [Bacteroidales bacterium]
MAENLQPIFGLGAWEGAAGVLALLNRQKLKNKYFDYYDNGRLSLPKPQL